MAEVVTAYGDRGLALVYRHYPLSQHNKALLMAQAAEAAAAQGKFWEMHDLIFAKQAEWTTKSLAEAETTIAGFARTLGLEPKKFATDLVADATSDKIKADMASGERAGVAATPTFYLNGRFFKAGTAGEFKAAIEAALAENNDSVATTTENSN